jgi:uncharacterized protein involved in outer membrane biogenesis
MKRWLIVLIVVFVVCGALMVAVGLALRSAIRGAEKDKLIASLGDKIGVPISVATVDLDLSQWFHFRPAVALGGVVIGNPPGFHAKDMLEAKTISARLSLLPLFHKTVEVESIAVGQPQIVVETGANGITNVEAFLKKLSSAGNTPSSGPATSVSIGELSVTSGTVTYAGGQNVTLHDVNLHASGLSADRPCRIQLSAKYSSGSVSGFKVEGQAGPFTSDSLPVDATLSLTIAPSEIPEDLRREQFGVMLATPGDKARAGLEATIKGDFYRTITGPAKLTLSRVMIGGHQDHLLALSGDAPSQFTATSIMSNPQFQLDISSAKLQLGKGQWSGSAKFGMQGKVMSGNTRGAIRDIDINEFLSSFTSSSGKVYGSLSMPSSALQFSGSNSAETLNSLTGTAKISVTQGRIAGVDLPATLERVFGNPQSTDAMKGSTTFSVLSADINIAERKMNIANLLLESPAVRVTGSGVIGFDQSINFALVAHVAGGRLGQVINTGPLHLPNVNADIPITVTGTVESPQVHPQIGKMAKTVVNDTVRGILGQILKKKP